MTKDAVLDKKVPLIWLIGIVFTVFGWGVRLEGTVAAMQDKGVKLRSEYEQSVVDMRADIKAIREDQIKILVDMGLQPSAN